MPILITAVVFVALLGVLNLMLTMAVVRQLRAHTTRLDELSRGNPELELLPVGTPLPTFSGRTLVAFLSTTCDACHVQVPELVRYLAEHGVARDAALVVVVGDVDDPVGRQLADSVAPVATVVREPSDGPVSGTLGVRMFPTFYLLDDDSVVRSRAIAVSELAEPVRA